MRNAKLKYCLSFVLLFIGLSVNASTIVTGLSTENLVSWNVWVNNNGKLKQQLLLYNRAAEPISIKIKLKKYQSENTWFKEIETDTTFYDVILKPNQLLELAYPNISGNLSFLKYFENGKSIGLMTINLDKPPQSFVKKRFKYYTMEGMNSGRSGYWMRLKSIYDAKTEIGFLTTELERTDEFYLLRCINNETEWDMYRSKLSSVYTTDNSIIKLTRNRNRAGTKLEGEFNNQNLLIFPILTEFVWEKYPDQPGSFPMRIPIFRKG